MAGLLASCCQLALTNLVGLDLGAVRITSEEAFARLAQLTALEVGISRRRGRLAWLPWPEDLLPVSASAGNVSTVYSSKQHAAAMHMYQLLCARAPELRLCPRLLLQELQLCVYSNADAPVVLDLEVLAPLTRLQVLQLTKQRAYFAEQRTFKVGAVGAGTAAADTVADTAAVALCLVGGYAAVCARWCCSTAVWSCQQGCGCCAVA